MWLVKNIYLTFAFLICLLIFIKSKEYFFANFSKGFLLDKVEIFYFYKFFLYTHIIASPLAFICGLFQFSFTKSKLHKSIGKLYLVLVLFFAAPSGLLMSYFAIGGLISIINFSVMSLLWFYFTFKALISIQNLQISVHEQFMTRSFIVANSAILIRILSFLNNHYVIIDITTGYIIISWMSWLPCLLIYEIRLKALSN